MRIFGKSRVAAVTTAFMIVVGTAACSSGTSPDEKPTQARIEVEGTAPGPLELVVSTDFYEDVQDGQVIQVKNSADTSFVSLPFDNTVFLTDLGSVLVELTNHADETAQVQMRITLDNGAQPYQRSATMSEGGSLRYVYVFLQRRL